MIQVLDKVPGFAESLGRNLGGGLGAGFSNAIQSGMQHKQKMELEQLKGEQKKKQDNKDLGHTFGTILDEMKGLAEHVGPSWTKPEAWNPWSKEAGKRSQINNIRLSLEGLFRDLTLKGQMPKAIYERILNELPQANDTKEQYLNKIEGIEKTLHAHFGDGESSREEGQKSKKMKFNISNPEHKAKRDQLMKKFKNNREKVTEALSREFEE